MRPIYFPLRSALTKPIASLLVLAVILPAWHPAFAASDDRYSLPAPDYRSDYRSPTPTGVSSPVDRQISLMNMTLAFQRMSPSYTQQVPTFKPAFQLPQLKFDFKPQFNNPLPDAKKAFPIDPQALSAKTKPGFLGGAQKVFASIGQFFGAGLQKIGQGFAAVGQRLFGGKSDPAPTPQQREVIGRFANLRPLGPNQFQTTGGQTHALGHSWEPGSNFSVQGDDLHLIQGTTFTNGFAGLESSTLVPVKMAGDGPQLRPIGLDLDKLAPKTEFRITQPFSVPGLGTLDNGKLLFESSRQESGHTVGVFSVIGGAFRPDQGLKGSLGLQGPATVSQLQVTLAAGLMRVNGAVINHGSVRTFVSEKSAPQDVAGLPARLDEIAQNAQKDAADIHAAAKDLSVRAHAVNAHLARLSGGETAAAPFRFELSSDFAAALQNADQLAHSAARAQTAFEKSDFDAALSVLPALQSGQAALQSTKAKIESQSAALRSVEHALSGAVQAQGAAPLTPAQLASLISDSLSKHTPAALSSTPIPVTAVSVDPVSSAAAPAKPRGLIGGVVQMARGFVTAFAEAVMLPIRAGQRLALLLGKAADHSARAVRRTEQYAAGVVFGVLSGDIFDKANPIQFDPNGIALITINGIWNDPIAAGRINSKVQEAFGITKSVIIANNTHFFKIGDLFQILGHETLGALDKPAIQTALAIRQGIKTKGSVYVFAHSQGTAIFRRAMDLLTKEEIGKIHYLGVGPEWVVNSKADGLASAKNVWNRGDIVPFLGNWLAAPLNFALPFRVGRLFLNEVAFTTKRGTGSAHLFTNYIPEVRAWAREVSPTNND